MSVDWPAPFPDDGSSDLLRRLVGWAADVTEANPHVVRHPDGCGLRLFCDRPAHRADGYRRVELMRNGYLVLNCEGLELRPGEPRCAERRAGITK